MKIKILIVGMVFLLVPWLLVSCGISQELYDAAVAERDSLVANLQSVQSEFEAAKSELKSIQSEFESIKAEVQSVKDELDAKISDLQSIENELDTKTSELNSAKNQLDSSEAELNKVKDELSEIKEVYPARHFDTYTELRTWVRSNDVSEQPIVDEAEKWYEKALDIQEAALKDGYIISAWIEYYPDEEVYVVICTAVADGDVWMWDPETNDLFNFSQLTGFLTIR